MTDRDTHSSLSVHEEWLKCRHLKAVRKITYPLMANNHKSEEKITRPEISLRRINIGLFFYLYHISIFVSTGPDDNASIQSPAGTSSPSSDNPCSSTTL